ncbi:hypothetical protein LH437_07955 [Laribacter hongkongensis]|nr:hypothetical protein [Laribacter hongkongensis]
MVLAVPSLDLVFDVDLTILVAIGFSHHPVPDQDRPTGRQFGLTVAHGECLGILLGYLGWGESCRLHGNVQRIGISTFLRVQAI